MVELCKVSKQYKDTMAIHNLSIRLDQPGIYCLLGRNGAGKTTLLKLIAGHIAPTSGQVLVYEKPVSMLAMPEDVHFVETGAAQFNISLTELFEAASVINPSFDMALAQNMARRFRLDLGKKFKHLSFGMKAMASTLIALSSGKDILILDEPVLGFDPVMRRTFYEMLSESVADKPKMVIVSTHIIDEIARVAERLLIIDKGRLLLNCEIAELDEKAYSVTGPAEQVKAATSGLRTIGESEAGGFLSRYIYDRQIDSGDGCTVASLGLADFFFCLVGGEEEVV